jgi:hypothetical protein
VRLGVLVVLVGIGPLALACHATPYTDGAARLWWRALLGTLATVVLQALTLHTALSVFLSPDANLPTLGIPHDPTGTFNLFLVLCLLWVVIKIPALMRRYVTGGGGNNIAGLIVRMALVQQLTGMLRTPLRHSGGGGRRAASAAGGLRIRGGGGRGGPARPGGGGTRLPQSLGSGAGPSGSRGQLPRPRGAGSGRVGVAWPTGRPVRPYTAQEIAAGVDPYTRRMPKTPPPQPPRSSRPPIRAAGLQSTPPLSGSRPVIPTGVTPATAVPKTRPIRPPVTGPWSRPTRRR